MAVPAKRQESSSSASGNSHLAGDALPRGQGLCLLSEGWSAVTGRGTGRLLWPLCRHASCRLRRASSGPCQRGLRRKGTEIGDTFPRAALGSISPIFSLSPMPRSSGTAVRRPQAWRFGAAPFCRRLQGSADALRHRQPPRMPAAGEPSRLGIASSFPGVSTQGSCLPLQPLSPRGVLSGVFVATCVKIWNDVAASLLHGSRHQHRRNDPST